MTEPCLLSIMEAADPDDRDDVAIRKLLVAALSSSGIELAQIVNDRIPPLLTLCELRAARRKRGDGRGRRIRPTGRARKPIKVARR